MATDARIQLAKRVLDQLHSSSKERVASDNVVVDILKEGQRQATMPYTIKSYGTTAAQAPFLRGTSRHGVADLPTNAHSLSADVAAVQLSVPYPHLQAMQPDSPPPASTRHCADTDSMSIFAHVVPLPSYAVIKRADSARVPAEEKQANTIHGGSDSMSLRASVDRPGTVDADVSAMVRGASSACSSGSHQNLGVAISAGLVERVYSDVDVQTFRHHFDAIGSLIATNSSNVVGSFNGVPQSVIDSRISGLVQQGIRDPRLKQSYSSTTKELIGSLSAFRSGLQAMEQARQQRNVTLNRDPADYDHIAWGRSLPYGKASQFPAM